MTRSETKKPLNSSQSNTLENILSWVFMTNSPAPTTPTKQPITIFDTSLKPISSTTASKNFFSSSEKLELTTSQTKILNVEETTKSSSFDIKPTKLIESTTEKSTLDPNLALFNTKSSLSQTTLSIKSATISPGLISHSSTENQTKISEEKIKIDLIESTSGTIKEMCGCEESELPKVFSR